MVDSLYEVAFSGKLYNPSETLNLMIASDYVDFDVDILEKSINIISTNSLDNNSIEPFTLTKKHLKKSYLQKKRETKTSILLDEKFVDLMFKEEIREIISKKF